MATKTEGITEIVDEAGFRILYDAELGRNGKYFNLQIHTDRWTKPSDIARMLIQYAAMLVETKTAEVRDSSETGDT